MIKRFKNDRVSPSVVGENFQADSESIIGKGTIIGEKTSIKKSCIGDDCIIGPQVKLNGCVVMNNVVVENA